MFETTIFIHLYPTRCLSKRKQHLSLRPRTYCLGAWPPQGTGKLSIALLCLRKGSTTNKRIQRSMESNRCSGQGKARQPACIAIMKLFGLWYPDLTEIRPWRRVSRRTFPNHFVLCLNPNERRLWWGMSAPSHQPGNFKGPGSPVERAKSMYSCE